MSMTDEDIWLFNEGTNLALYKKMGAHCIENGCHFTVWAPHANYVSVIGDFNKWNYNKDPLKPRDDDSGLWECVVPNVSKGQKYKYYLKYQNRRYRNDKVDPFANFCEQPPGNAAIIWDINNYQWDEKNWVKNRTKLNSLNSPISIYEIHLPSWRRIPDENNRSLNYRELAKYLPEYIQQMGFTHVQFLPIMEHPFYGSWGYQTTGYFAPTSRYGTPQDFMFLIESLHQAGIGVFLDWVPSHFPSDSHGLAFFDGSHLYEYGDPMKGFHPDWNTFIFDYGKNQVRSFLISSALFWLDKYHVDGLRVDAVASMLYLDYSRGPGQWKANAFGGRENLEAIDFLRQLNAAAYEKFPYIQTIAEESTAWPLVSRPNYLGGLGFGMKWNMGWMHDTLKYISLDPIYRKYHHNSLLFSIHYAFSENFVLPLSHDEVVYGKGSLIRKMPGDEWQKFANLRLLYGYMYAHPGKKLMFMGGEFGQWNEWNHETSLDWHLLDIELHNQLQTFVSDLNHLYKDEPCLYEWDFTTDGFEWINTHDWEQSVISFIRKSKNGESIIIVCNFTPVPRHNYLVGVPKPGFYKEILNSDSRKYGGSGLTNSAGIPSEDFQSFERCCSIKITLPPLAVVYFQC